MQEVGASLQKKDKEGTIHLKDLRSLQVLLVQPNTSEGASLRSHLMRIGCSVREIWPPPRDYPEDINVVFVMVDRIVENKLTLNWKSEDPPAVLIAVIDYENPLSIDRLLKMRVDTVIGLPIRPFGILTNLLVTINNHRREQKIRSRCNLLQSRLESSRIIERAKLAIMLMNNRTEEEAYALLREMAMKRRLPVDVVSREVLDAMTWREDTLTARQQASGSSAS